jgi:hypothetical protein
MLLHYIPQPARLPADGVSFINGLSQKRLPRAAPVEHERLLALEETPVLLKVWVDLENRLIRINESISSWFGCDDEIENGLSLLVFNVLLLVTTTPSAPCMKEGRTLDGNSRLSTRNNNPRHHSTHGTRNHNRRHCSSQTVPRRLPLSLT